MRLSFALAALSPLVPAVLDAQAATSAAPPRADVVARLDSLSREALASEPMAGVSVAVVRGRDTLLVAGYGMADIGLAVPVTPATTFRVIGMPVLAAALMQQVEAGKLRLDDDAARLLPDFPWQGRHVSVRQLMDATSGLQDYHYRGDPHLAQRGVPKAHDEVTALFAGLPYAHEPGAKYQWTTSGFHLVGGLVERVTGMRFGDYARDQVIARAGLTRTYSCDDRSITPGLARGYDPAFKGFRNAAVESASLYPFTATICATAADVAAFARALRDGRLMTPESWRAMTTPAGAARPGSIPGDSTAGRGIGLRAAREGGHRWIGESGSLMAYSSALMDFPDDSLTIAVLSNTAGQPAARLARQLARAALGLPPLPVPRARAPRSEVASRATLSPAERAQYLGTYRLHIPNPQATYHRFQRTYRVFEENGRFSIQALGDAPQVLLPQGDHVFKTAASPEVQWVFTVDGDRAMALTMRVGTIDSQTGPRVDDGAAPNRGGHP